MKPRASVLRYQLRYSDGGEPETLIATDGADALQQARRRAERHNATVALWRDGALVAECRPSPEPEVTHGRMDVIARLVEAGIYVFTSPLHADREESQSPERRR